MKPIFKIGIAGGIFFLAKYLIQKSKNEYIIIKNEINYNHTEHIYNSNDVGYSYLDINKCSYFVDNDKQKIYLNLVYITTLSAQLIPNADTYMNYYNPGLSEEVYQHEKIHIQICEESLNNFSYIYDNKNYTGAVNEIIEQIINSGAITSTEKLNALIVDIIIKADFEVRNIYPDLESEVNRRLRALYPLKTKFYNNGTIEIIYE